MLNVGGGEFLVILLVALIVLGPQKLPEAARQVGHFARELRKMSNAFQSEMRDAMEDPIAAAAKDRGPKVVASEESAAPDPDEDATDAPSGDEADAVAVDDDADDGAGDETEAVEDAAPVSSAEAAGMYDISPSNVVVDDDDDDEHEGDEGDEDDEEDEAPAGRVGGSA